MWVHKTLVFVTACVAMFLGLGFPFNMSVLYVEFLDEFGKSNAETAVVQSVCTSILLIGDSENKGKYLDTISDIVSASNSVWEDKRAIAKYSVNGEQILEAHKLVCQIRKEIQSLAQDELTDNIRSLILEKIGQALFVIQSFYSNTNWVDMNGATVYESFGLCGLELMSIASRGEATCKDCSVLASTSCESTLMTPDVLTSGYKSGQDILKPEASWSRKTIGKCSHGGQHDDTRTTTAKGGINKETTHSDYSPMKHLHIDAANAAIEATEFFFIGQDSGILSVLGTDLFMSVLHVIRRKPTSLTLVVDVTGSMSNEIEDVKKECVNIVTSKIGTNNEPTNYILSTFSDPVSLTTTYETTDGTEMITKLSSLSADGGDDCAEYSMDGLLKGVELSKTQSTVYMITDAPAKDCSEKDKVMDLARSKNITVQIILPRECSQDVCVSDSVRKRRAWTEYVPGTYISATDNRFNNIAAALSVHRSTIRSNRHSRSASIYKEIAQATGGALYQPKNGISEVLNELIESDLSSSEVLVHLFDSPSSENTPIQINVDSDIQLLKFEIFGSSSETEASVKNTAGLTEYTLRYYSNQVIIITVVNPASGIWTLVKHAVLDWSVRITAEAVMDISYRLVETDSDGYAYQVQGNPIEGQNYTLEVTVTDAIENATDFTIVVMRENGEEIVSSAVSCTESVVGKICPITLTVPTEKAYLQLQGRDREGHLFRRTSDSPIIPVAVKLRLGVITSSLYIGVQHNLSYILSNSGGDNGTFTVQYTHDKSNSTIDSTSHVLTSGESVDGSFYITGNSDGEVVKYTISVVSDNNTSLLQSLSRNVMFTSKQHPVCAIINKVGNCTSSANRCSMTTWSTTSQISYSGVSLQSIYLSNVDSSVTLDYDNNTGSPVNVTVSGTCCTTSVYLNVVDDESYSDRCHLQFGDEHRMLIQVTDNLDSKDQSEEDSNTTLTVTFVSCSAVLLIILAVVIWKCKVQPYTKTGLQNKRYLSATDSIKNFLLSKNSNQNELQIAPTVNHLHENENKKYFEVTEYTSSPRNEFVVTPPPSFKSSDLQSLFTDSRSSTLSEIHM